MARISKLSRHAAQADLFKGETFVPVLSAQDMPRALDLKRQVANLMGQAVRESGDSIPVVAAKMTELLGDDTVTTQQLYAYTSPSKVSHNISLVRWVAFVRATGAIWLWDALLRDEGLTVLQGAEALHAQASLIEKKARAALDDAKALRAMAPMEIRGRGPSR